MFKLYIFSLMKIFYDKKNIIILTIINTSDYVSDIELQLIIDDLQKNTMKNLTIKFDLNLTNDNIPNNQELAFKNFKVVNSITDTYLSYDYNKIAKFLYHITSHFIDLLQSFKNYDKYEEKFENKMNILQQLSFKNKKFIILNLSTYSNIVLPDLYYIKALALIFNTLKLKSNDFKNLKIIVCYDSKINPEAYDKFVLSLSGRLNRINKFNFMPYNEIKKFYSQLDNDEFIFYLNMFNFPTICSQNNDYLIPCFLKDYHKTLDWDLYSMTVFSKKLFTDTLIARSFGI